jgi:hypothetical protein
VTKDIAYTIIFFLVVSLPVLIAVVIMRYIERHRAWFSFYADKCARIVEKCVWVVLWCLWKLLQVAMVVGCIAGLVLLARVLGPSGIIICLLLVIVGLLVFISVQLSKR